MREFQFFGKTITSIDVAPLSFSKFIKLMQKPTPRGMKPAAHILRERMKAQIVLKADKEEVRLTDETIGQLPTLVGNSIIKLLNSSENEGAGSIVSEGADGVTQSIIYKLGTPIKAVGGDEITELEFLARTFGQIEDVLSEHGDGAMTLMLLEKVAAPPMGKLLVLTSNEVEQVSLADGLRIMSDILPVFLKGAEE